MSVFQSVSVEDLMWSWILLGVYILLNVLTILILSRFLKAADEEEVRLRPATSLRLSTHAFRRFAVPTPILGPPGSHQGSQRGAGRPRACLASVALAAVL